MKRQARHILWAVVWVAAIVPAAQAQIDPSASLNVPVYLEDSPAAQEMVDRAFHLRDQGRYVDASAVMQQIIEQFPQKLMKVAGPTHEDAARWVRRTIREEADWLGAYRRAYEPEAARLLAMARMHEPDAAALTEVVRRFLLCPSGIEAALELAGVCLERGAAVDAATLLDDLVRHPDLAAHAARYHHLCAAEAAISGDQVRLDVACAELDRLQADAALAEVEAIAVSARPDAAALAGAQLPESFDAPLWQTPLPEAPAADNALLLRRAPTLWGRMVLINTGMAVIALDRASGRELWTTGNVAQNVPDIQAGRFFSAQRLLPDERSAVVWGNHVIAVLGPDITQSGRRQWWQPSTFLVVASRDDGQVVWQKQPQDLDPSLENAFFHGTPIIGYDRAYVLLRRSQVSGFHDAFVAAVDMATGKLIWRRHLSSAASGHRYAARPLAQMTAARGRLYITDKLGVVSCIDGRSGDVVWSCLMAEATSSGDPLVGVSRGASAALNDPPLVTDAGVIVPSWAPGAPVLVLDKETGEVARELTTPAWTQAVLLVQAADAVLAVGTDVLCFDGRTLALRWVHEGDEPPVARPVVLGTTLVVPRQNRLVSLDMATGRLQADLRSAPAAGLVVDDGQVILTTNASVASYMPWARAYANLSRQMQADPTDPAPGVALAYVATALDRPDAVIEGVDHAVAAMRKASSVSDVEKDDAAALARGHVFAQLLSFTDGTRVTDPALRRKLFQRIGAAAATAADEVAYRLALGEFETQIGQYDAATDHYQSILLDDTLSAQLHAQDGAIRQAWMEAKRRLTALVAQHGQAVYARHDAAASVRLNEILTTRGGDPTLLEDMAARYPLSPAATQALIAAADATATRGDLDAAMPLLRQAYRQTTQIDIAAQLVGRLAQLSLQLERPRIAQRWLETAARQYPGIRPVREGQAVSVDQWLAELTALDGGAEAFASLQLPIGPATLLDGRIVPLPARSENHWLRDRIVLQRGTSVELRHGHTLDRRWSTGIGVEQPLELLWLDEEQAVFWSAAAGRLVSLDAATGRRLRNDVDAAPLLRSIGDPRQRAAEQVTPEQDILRDMIEQPVILRQGGVIRLVNPAHMIGEDGPATYAASNEWVVVLADELGRVVCLDRRDGQMLWRMLAPMQRISSIHLDADSLVIGGITDPGTDAQGGMVVVLDPGTGERRCPAIEVRNILQFVTATESRLVYATTTEVVAHHLADGAVAWRLPIEMGNGERTLSGQGWLDGDSLVLAEGGVMSGLLVIHAGEGKLMRRIVGADLGMGEPLSVRRVGRQWQLRAPKMVAALDDAGAVIWRDAAVLEGARFIHQVIGQNVVVAIATTDGAAMAAAQPNIIIQGGDQRVMNLQLQLRLRAAQVAAAAPADDPADAQTRRYIVYAFERESGRLVGEYQLGPLPAALNPAAAILLDGRIAIACGTQTLILPGEE